MKIVTHANGIISAAPDDIEDDVKIEAARQESSSRVVAVRPTNVHWPKSSGPNIFVRKK